MLIMVARKRRRCCDRINTGLVATDCRRSAPPVPRTMRPARHRHDRHRPPTPACNLGSAVAQGRPPAPIPAPVGRALRSGAVVARKPAPAPRPPGRAKSPAPGAGATAARRPAGASEAAASGIRSASGEAGLQPANASPASIAMPYWTLRPTPPQRRPLPRRPFWQYQRPRLRTYR